MTRTARLVRGLARGLGRGRARICWIGGASLVAAALGCHESGAASEGVGVGHGGADATAPAALDPSPKSCAACHPDEYRGWQGSLHAQAWEDPVFRAEYDPAPSPWCRDCHDPPSRMHDNPGHGIDCATCHLHEGRVLASATSPAAELAHAIEVDPALASSQRCARCHQFKHADDGMHDAQEALQNTLVEWQASDAARAGKGCVNCHLRGHTLVGLSDPELVAGAVEVELSPRSSAAGLAVEVRVSGREIGHAFPTGDVFRVARLSLHARGPGGAVLAESHIDMKRWLGRSADPNGLDSHVRTLDDTRVPPPGQGSLERHIELTLDAEAVNRVESLAWTLELHRLPPHRARARGLGEELTRIAVGAGVVDVPRPE